MRLAHDLHLAYCTNIHRGSDWPETLASLEHYTLAVKERISPDRPYAIGLRLSDLASRQLSEPHALDAFHRWLQQHQCYVFTINGFPFGQFHGGKVKEQVYRPDWTHPDRLDYTNRLFDLLAQLVPEGVEGSISTLPGSFKAFITTDEQRGQMRDQLWRCIEHIEQCSVRHGRKLHLGLEPEPLGLFETSAETVRFFQEMEAHRPNDPRLRAFLGVNYDTCHLAVEYEEPGDVVAALQNEGIRISKIHLSSALQIAPDEPARAWLRRFADDTYLHQVVARTSDGTLRRDKDLDVAFGRPVGDREWRIHFHVPLHAATLAHGQTTAPHLLGLLDLLAKQPALCSHLEMETYTWEVLPEELRAKSVVEQLVHEYDWCLAQLAERGLREGMKALLERLRTLLILGRVSNLPTVWSNLIAGSIVAYMDITPSTQALVLLGGSFIYIGGMYLNDFCDAKFDAQYCPQRPIPSGKVSRRAVGILAAVWFAAGLACIAPFGWQPVEVALLLVAAILLYDFHHKNVSWAPLVMGFCRFLLYPLAATVASSPYDLWSLHPFLISPDLLWHPVPDGIALAIYVAGITYLARGESRPDRSSHWAIYLLLAPVATALAYCILLPYLAGPPQFFCLVLMGWMAWLLIPLWRGTNHSVGRVVSGLLAGIVLVDMIAVTPMLGFQATWLLLLFGLALLLQRVIPAT